jgi:hypothetical protein
MLENDYTNIVTTTLMYAMCERVLMDKLEKTNNPWNNRMILNLWPPTAFIQPIGFLVKEQHDPNIN